MKVNLEYYSQLNWDLNMRLAVNVPYHYTFGYELKHKAMVIISTMDKCYIMWLLRSIDSLLIRGNPSLLAEFHTQSVFLSCAFIWIYFPGLPGSDRKFAWNWLILCAVIKNHKRARAILARACRVRKKHGPCSCTCRGRAGQKATKGRGIPINCFGFCLLLGTNVLSNRMYSLLLPSRVFYQISPCL